MGRPTQAEVRARLRLVMGRARASVCPGAAVAPRRFVAQRSRRRYGAPGCPAIGTTVRLQAGGPLIDDHHRRVLGRLGADVLDDRLELREARPVTVRYRPADPERIEEGRAASVAGG